MRYLMTLMISMALLSAGPAQGAVPGNVKLTVVAAPTGAAAQGEKQVRAEALCARIATSEQLKTVALQLLEHLRSSYPNGRTYTLVLSDDARMMAIGNHLGVVTHHGGKTTVTGGVPSAMDIRMMRASRLEIRKPDERGLRVVYEVALLKREAAQKGTSLPDDRAYAHVARKLKLTPLQVRQLDRGVTQYYKAFEGKPF